MKPNNQLFLSLSTEPLAILPGFLESFLFNIANGVEGRTPTQNFGITQTTTSTGGKVMIIPIQGIITTNSYPEHGIFGMRDVQNALETAKNDSEIIGVVLYIKSPGGSMSLVAETADLIFEFPKPIEAYCEELVASSAYYLAAATDKITVTPRSTIVGNVGSKISYMNTDGIYEQMGAKLIEVYGTKAVNKDLGHNDAKAGKPDKLRKILIDPANQMFIDDVLRYRPQLTESQLDGMVWYSEDAVKNNFADATGTLQDVIKGFNFSNNNVKNTMGQLVKLTFEEGTIAHTIAKAIAVTETEPATPAATPPVEVPAPVAVLPIIPAITTPEQNPLEARLQVLEANLTQKDTVIAVLQAELVTAKSVNPAATRITAIQEGIDPVAGKNAENIPDYRQTDAEFFANAGIKKPDATATTK